MSNLLNDKEVEVGMSKRSEEYRGTRVIEDSMAQHGQAGNSSATRRVHLRG